jgi:hypothetical protein
MFLPLRRGVALPRWTSALFSEARPLAPGASHE